MKKTPIRTDTLRIIANLNNQLCFFLLMESELISRLEDFGPGIQSAYMTDLFSKNPHAEKIHVRLSQVPTILIENRYSTFGAYFSTTYEIASGFFPKALELLQETTGIDSVKREKEGPESHYRRDLTHRGMIDLPERALGTFSYCRYRRNAFIHQDNLANNNFLDFVKNKGHFLNSAWSTSKGDIDFSKSTIESLSQGETIDMIKLLRISIEDLDAHLCSVVEPLNLIQLIVRQEFSHSAAPINSDVLKQRAKKVISKLMYEYELEVTLVDATTALKSNGWKR